MSLRSRAGAEMLGTFWLELVRMQADELAWLAARLNRRTADMDAMQPDSQDFRDAVLVSEVLAQEITAAVRQLPA